MSFIGRFSSASLTRIFTSYKGGKVNVRFFSFKKKVVRQIEGEAWGNLVNDHGYDVDTLSNFIRCVKKKGLQGNKSVTLLRIIDLREIAKKGIEIGSWETLDQHPDLILLEGHENEKGMVLFK
ncbi:MAG: hypothetical protein PHI99_04565 [Syntrophales bacterium]|nr:hypothetical protein [Syntrophales bacterium]